MFTWLRKTIRTHPLVSFFIIAYALTWTGSLVSYLATPGGGGRLPLLLNVPGALIWYYGPCLSALLVTWLSQGMDGLRNLRHRLFDWRVGWHWYAFILVYPLALHLSVVYLGWLSGGSPPRFFSAEGVSGGNIWLTLLGLTLWQVLVRGIGEETGWRGFALPHLQSRRGAFTSSLILGFLWALWHFHPANAALFSVAGVFIFLNILSTTLLFTWLSKHTRGSLLVAILFHTTLNLAEYVIPIGLTQAGLVNQFIQLALVWLAIAFLYNWKERPSRPLTPDITRDKLIRY